MAKISPVSIKYMIHASFKAEGPLERPDVIGAIFGQTEGLLATALETIDRIGPTEAEIKITKIEDVRGGKRDFIIDRAKQLLESLDSGSDLGEMSKALKEETRAARIQEYGNERLPAGDLSGNEIIVVEGRADVINLLKN